MGGRFRRRSSRGRTAVGRAVWALRAMLVALQVALAPAAVIADRAAHDGDIQVTAARTISRATAPGTLSPECPWCLFLRTPAAPGDEAGPPIREGLAAGPDIRGPATPARTFIPGSPLARAPPAIAAQ